MGLPGGVAYRGLPNITGARSHLKQRRTSREKMDKTYRNQRILWFCEGKGIRLSGPRTDKPKLEKPEVDRNLTYRDSEFKRALYADNKVESAETDIPVETNQTE
jgi:hypothetical protein